MRLSKVGDWEHLKDSETHQVFYYNHKTGASQWEMPAEFKQDDEVEKKEWSMKRTRSMATRKRGDWEEFKDEESGALFYVNHKTGASQWEMPAEFKQDDEVEEKEWSMKRTRSMATRTRGEWQEMKDEESGALFYYSASRNVYK